MRKLEGLGHFLTSIQVIPWSKLEKRAKKPLRRRNPQWLMLKCPFLFWQSQSWGEASEQYENLPKPNPVRVVVNPERNLDAVKPVFTPSFYKVMGMLNETMSPKPQDTLESACANETARISAGIISFWVAIPPPSDVQAVLLVPLHYPDLHSLWWPS